MAEPRDGIAIRPIRPEDGPAYVALSDRATAETTFLLREPWEPSPWADDPERSVRELLGRGNGMVLLAEDEGRPVGWVLCRGGAYARDRGCGHVVAGVLQSHVGRGIGARLFSALEDWARGAGLHRLELSVQAHNARAVALYRRMGYVEEGRRRRSLRIAGQWVDELSMGRLLVPEDAPTAEPLDLAPSAPPADAGRPVVRPLRPADAAAVAAFDAVFRRETPFLLRTPEEVARPVEAIARMLAGEDGGDSHLGAMIDGPGEVRMVGMLALHRGRYARIAHRGTIGMGLLRAWWGLGLGRGLLAAAEERARALGLRRLELEVLATNPRAQRLYRRNGYEVEGVARRAVLVDGRLVDQIRMAKLLDP